MKMVCEPLKSLGILGSPPCSADDIAKGRFVQASFPQNASYCAMGQALIAQGLATSVTCCNDKNLCNAVPTLRCYNGAESNIRLQTVASLRYCCC